MIIMNSNHFWKNIIFENLKKVISDPSLLSNLKKEDYEKIRDVFVQCDGSWMELAEGGPDQCRLLRKCCKAFLKVRKSKGVRPYVGKDGETQED
jgi:hypothetical protein